MSDAVSTDVLRAAGERADYFETGEGPLWRAAADEVDRLRAVIENAPHRFNCQKRMTGVHLRSQGQADNCTCWKAGVV